MCLLARKAEWEEEVEAINKWKQAAVKARRESKVEAINGSNKQSSGSSSLEAMVGVERIVGASREGKQSIKFVFEQGKQE